VAVGRGTYVLVSADVQISERRPSGALIEFGNVTFKIVKRSNEWKLAEIGRITVWKKPTQVIDHSTLIDFVNGVIKAWEHEDDKFASLVTEDVVVVHQNTHHSGVAAAWNFRKTLGALGQHSITNHIIVQHGNRASVTTDVQISCKRSGQRTALGTFQVDIYISERTSNMKVENLVQEFIWTKN